MHYQVNWCFNPHWYTDRSNWDPPHCYYKYTRLGMVSRLIIARHGWGQDNGQHFSLLELFSLLLIQKQRNGSNPQLFFLCWSDFQSKKLHSEVCLMQSSFVGFFEPITLQSQQGETLVPDQPSMASVHGAAMNSQLSHDIVSDWCLCSTEIGGNLEGATFSLHSSVEAHNWLHPDLRGQAPQSAGSWGWWPQLFLRVVTSFPFLILSAGLYHNLSAEPCFVYEMVNS